MKKETIEMRVHHLDLLGSYMRSGRKQGFIKDNIILAKYDKGVTEEELNSFVSSIYKFYEKILRGGHKIKLTSKADGICNGNCTLRKTGYCNPKSLARTDIEEAEIGCYNVEIGKTYSLEEIIKIIKDFDSLIGLK